MHKFGHSCLALALVLLVAACGGGGGSSEADPIGSGGNPAATSAATIEDQQAAESLAQTAVEGVTEAVSQQSSLETGGVDVTPFSGRTSDSSPGAMVRSIPRLIATAGGVQPLAVERIEGFCGGELVTTTPDNSDIVEGRTLQASIVYTDFCLLDGFFLDGRIDITAVLTDRDAPAGTFSADYDLSVTVPDDPEFDIVDETVRGSQDCTFNADVIECRWSQTFASSRGGTIRIEGMVVEGNEIEGFTVNGRVFDAERGFVDVTTTAPLTFGCPDGSPDGGGFTFSDGDGNSVTVSFSGCETFTVTFNGSASLVSR